MDADKIVSRLYAQHFQSSDVSSKMVLDSGKIVCFSIDHLGNIMMLMC